MPTAFFISQLDYVFFVYGLSFFLLAASCWAISVSADTWRPWRVFGLFGLIHGALEWMDMVVLSQGDTPIFAAVRLAALAASFLCLLEFGRAASCEFTGKRTGRWIFLPFLALAAAGALAGHAGLFASTRHALGFPGGLWTAWALWRYGAVKPEGRRPARLAAAAMALYALTAGLVTPKAAFFPASFSNHDAFLAFFGLPVQLVRAALAATMAASVWRIRRILVAKAVFMRSPMDLASYGKAVTAGIIAIVAAGFWFTQWLGRYAEDLDEAVIRDRLDIAGKSLRIPMRSADALARLLASRLTALPGPERVGLKGPQVDLLLDETAAVIPESIAYVADASGAVAASSNRAARASLVGVDVASRQYFRQALIGLPGRMAAVGINTKIPGYFTGAALRDASGALLGVAAIKLNLDVLPGNLTRRGIMFLVDGNGIVLSSTRPEFVKRPLAPLPITAMTELMRSGIYHDLSSSAVLERPLDTTGAVSLGGVAMRVSRWETELDGLALVYFESPAETGSARLAAISATIFLSLLYTVVLTLRQKNREHADILTASERRYREMFQNTSSIQLLIDPEDWTVADANSAAIAFYGRPARSIQGMPLTEVERAPALEIAGRLSSSLAAGTPCRARHAAAAGPRDVEIAVGSVLVGGKTLLHAIIHDDTERARVEAQVAGLKNLLQGIIDSMPSILIGVDDQGLVTHFNGPAARAMALADALGRPVEEALPSMRAERGKIEAAIRHGLVQKTGKKPLTVAGETVYQDITVYPLTGEDAHGAVIRIDDVSERVRLEDMMIQSEKMMSIGGLAAGMAHEINNPLGIILQAAQNAQRRLSPSAAINRQVAEECGVDIERVDLYLTRRKIGEYLADIAEAGIRASKIVQSMLNFSRRSQSRRVFQSAAGLVDKSLELAGSDFDLKKNYDFKKINIVTDYDPGDPKGYFVETEIEQVFLNLIKNAAQAMADKAYQPPEQPTLTLRVHSDGHRVHIDVEDNGPGMDEATGKRILEPFFTTKAPGRGTGLGLSVSYFIVTSNYGGELYVASEPGLGTRFRVTLPLGRASDAS